MLSFVGLTPQRKQRTSADALADYADLMKATAMTVTNISARRDLLAAVEGTHRWLDSNKTASEDEHNAHLQDLENSCAAVLIPLAYQSPAITTCLITNAAMSDPVVASDGHVYGRFALQQLLKDGAALSPVTKLPLTDRVNGLKACPIAAATMKVVRECAMDASGPATAVESQSIPMDPPSLAAPRTDLLEKAGILPEVTPSVSSPTFVVVGHGKAGKSALLESLTGIAVFPRGDTTTENKVAVHVVLIRGPLRDPLMRIAPVDAPPARVVPEAPWRRVPAALLTKHNRLADVVGNVMEIIVSVTAESHHSFCAARQIQVIVQMPTASQLHVLELPSLTADGLPGHDVVHGMLKATVKRMAPTSRFLWVHSATMQSSHSSVGALLRDCRVLEKTTGVLSNCDRARSDDPDTPAVRVLADLLRDDVDEHSRAVGGGWFAVANPSSHKDAPHERLAKMRQREADALKRLSALPNAEAAEFESDVALVNENWGVGRLRQHVRTECNAFVRVHWARQVHRVILTRVRKECFELVGFGVPVEVPAGAPVAQLRRFVQEHLAAENWLRLWAPRGSICSIISQFFKHCLDEFELAKAYDSAVRAAYTKLADLGVAIAQMGEQFTSQTKAMAFAAKTQRDLHDAFASYIRAVQGWVGRGGPADAFVALAKIISARECKATSFALQPLRFENATQFITSRIRDSMRQWCLTAAWRRCPDHVLCLRGVPFQGCRGAVVVRGRDPEALRAIAEDQHWDIADAVRCAIVSSIDALGEVEASVVAEESPDIAARRQEILERCASLCDLYEWETVGEKEPANQRSQMVRP